MTLAKILNEYTDSLYCAGMLGGESGTKRARDARTQFVFKIEQLMEKGISHEDACYLLISTINLDKIDFLFALKAAPDFKAFEMALDKLKERAALIPSATGDMMTYFNYLRAITLSGGLARIRDENLPCYTSLYKSILDQSQSSSPSPKNIIDAVNELENQQARCRLLLICTKASSILGLAAGMLILAQLSKKPIVVAIAAATGGAFVLRNLFNVGNNIKQQDVDSVHANLFPSK